MPGLVQSAEDKEISMFLGWLNNQGQIAGKEGRVDAQNALKGLQTSIESFVQSPAEGKSSRWSAMYHAEGEKGPLLDTMRSFKKMYEDTLKFNEACRKNPTMPIDQVLPLFETVNQGAEKTLKAASNMEQSGSVKAALVGATLGVFGGAVSGAVKYGCKYAMEWYGGMTIPGVAAAIFGLAVGLVGGAIYGAASLAVKGWEAGKKWEVGRNVEEKGAQEAFQKANETLAATRDQARAIYKQGSSPASTSNQQSSAQQGSPPAMQALPSSTKTAAAALQTMPSDRDDNDSSRGYGNKH